MPDASLQYLCMELYALPALSLLSLYRKFWCFKQSLTTALEKSYNCCLQALL